CRFDCRPVIWASVYDLQPPRCLAGGGILADGPVAGDISTQIRLPVSVPGNDVSLVLAGRYKAALALALLLGRNRVLGGPVSEPGVFACGIFGAARGVFDNSVRPVDPISGYARVIREPSPVGFLPPDDSPIPAPAISVGSLRGRRIFCPGPGSMAIWQYQSA